MNIFQRISKLVSANINHALDLAEDPEVMVKQLIREMEESIIELRRETVKAIAQQKQLEKKILLTKGRIDVLEKKAGVALNDGDENVTRQIIANKLDMKSSLTSMQNELVTATDLAAKMKKDLTKLEDQVQKARRKKEEIIRRKRLADAQFKTQEMLRKSHQAMSAISPTLIENNSNIQAMNNYEEKVKQMETEVEASEEFLKMNEEDVDLEELAKNKAIEEELAKLKKKMENKGKEHS